MKLLKSIIIISFLSGFSNLNSQWAQTGGPEGGNVYAVLQSGAYLFAGLSHGGVYRSTNMGTNWSSANSGFLAGDENVQALYSYNNNIYAGNRSRLYVSADFGNNWNQVAGYLGSEVKDIKSSGVYLYAAGYGGVSVSSDNGVTWVLNNNGLTNLYVRALVLRGNNLIIGTEGGAFISTDNGVNWVNISSGLPQQSINDMAMLGDNVYAATAGGSVFKTSNNGLNWLYAGSGILYPNVLTIEAHGGTLFAADFSSGIYSSTNNGEDWELTSFNNGIPNNPTTWCLQSTGNVLFAGLLGDGLYGSTNSGTTWTSLNGGIIATSVSAFSSAGGLIFATALKRIFASSDNGNTWFSSSDGLNCIYFTVLNTDGDDLYAGSTCGVYLSNNGIYWQNVSSGFGIFGIEDITSYSGNVFAGTQNGVFHTTNRGSVWAPVNNGLTDLFVVMLKYYNGTLFASTFDGLFRSTNNGQLWTPSGSGLPQYTAGYDIVYHNGLLFLAASNGIYASSNNGASWYPRINGLQFYGTDAIISAGNFLIASHLNKFSYSSNNGSNWQPLNTGFNSICNSLFVVDSDILAGTQKGVYKFNRNVIAINPETENLPNEYRLIGNYPNPFNPSTIIKYEIPRDANVKIKVFDILGKEVFSLNEFKKAGSYDLKFDGSNLASGLYFYSLEASGFKDTKKMLLIK